MVMQTKPICKIYYLPSKAEIELEEEKKIYRLERAMSGVGLTAAILISLMFLLVVYVQCGKHFLGW